MIVMKFGGSSVANRAQIEKVRNIVAAARDRKPVVVSSAHKGVTDALIDTARDAADGKDDGGEAVIAKQQAIAESLGCAPELLAAHYGEIRDLLRGIRLVGELSPRSLDYISSFGERMSVRCIADSFTREGVKAQAFDAWDLGFITDASASRGLLNISGCSLPQRTRRVSRSCQRPKHWSRASAVAASINPAACWRQLSVRALAHRSRSR